MAGVAGAVAVVDAERVENRLPAVRAPRSGDVIGAPCVVGLSCETLAVDRSAVERPGHERDAWPMCIRTDT